MRSGDSGLTITIIDIGSESSKSKALFCCDVEWIGFQSGPGNLATLSWDFTRYNVPSANAYRHNFTVFRNDVLFWAGTFASTGDTNCPDHTIILHWLDGFGNCCGVFSATMVDEYRVGNTWYGCNADHGEFNYFPFGCLWCE